MSKQTDPAMSSAGSLQQDPNVVCSTLSQIPGQSVVEVLPTVFAVATQRMDVSIRTNDYDYKLATRTEEALHAGAQGLAQKAQAALAQQAAAQGCNALVLLIETHQQVPRDPHIGLRESVVVRASRTQCVGVV